MIRYFLILLLILALLACDVVAEPTRWPTSTPPIEQDASSELSSAEKEDPQSVKQPPYSTPMISNTKLTPDAETVVTESGLKIKDFITGTGDRAREGSIVVVHYTGSLLDGTKFDSSVDRGEPLDLPVNGVIPGWQEALQMMKEGDKWRLIVPPDLGYGAAGVCPIPGNTTLIFQVELIKVR